MIDQESLLAFSVGRRERKGRRTEERADGFSKVNLWGEEGERGCWIKAVVDRRKNAEIMKQIFFFSLKRGSDWDTLRWDPVRRAVRRRGCIP